MESKRRVKKLHELLAAEPDCKGEFEAVVKEARKTFKDKASHFDGFHRTLKMRDESREQEETAGEEKKVMVTTVSAKLKYLKKAFVNYLDSVYQKEMTNQTAVANLHINGDTIAESVPATCLLAFESKLKFFRAMCEEIPTWAPGDDWKSAPDMGEGIYKSEHPETALKTEQIIKPQVLYEATKDHPAQVDKLSEQVAVGLFTKNKWTGKISPAQKSKLLGSIDTAIREVKMARMRANEAEVVGEGLAGKLFDSFLSSLGN